MLQEAVSRSTVVLGEPWWQGGSEESDEAGGVLAALSGFELAERLVRVWIRSDQHLQTLDVLNARLTCARRHVDSAPSRPALAAAYIERLREKRAGCLAMLRAERQAALALMAESDARAAVGGRRRAVGA